MSRHGLAPLPILPLVPLLGVEGLEKPIFPELVLVGFMSKRSPGLQDTDQ